MDERRIGVRQPPVRRTQGASLAPHDPCDRDLPAVLYPMCPSGTQLVAALAGGEPSLVVWRDAEYRKRATPGRVAQAVDHRHASPPEATDLGRRKGVP